MAETVTLNLLEQQEKNRRQTTIWMVAFVLFFAWIGFGGDAVLYFNSMDVDGVARYRVPWIGIVVTAIAALVTWNAWRGGPRELLKAAGAQPIEEARTPDERLLINVVEEMAIAGGLPMPKVYIIDDDDPNAFATGHGPETASVAVTKGLLKVLNRDQLQGVVAHEMAHVRNLDVRLMTTIAALVGVIVLLSDVLSRFMRHGGGRALAGGGGRSRGKGGNPLVLILLVLWIISIILAPLITRLMAMAVSRNREYLADATAAELTRNPAALAEALGIIEGSHAPTRSIAKSAAHLCIADPLGRKVNLKEGRMANLFGTHPPMPVRIARLRGMAFQSAKLAGELPAEG